MVETGTVCDASSPQGNSSLEYEGFNKAMIGVKAVSEMEKVRQRVEKNNMPRDLVSVLLATSAARCTDPRDKIFAVLGLVDEEYPRLDKTLQIEVDYAEDVGQVYRNLAEKCIAARDLRILSCVSQRHGTLLDKEINIPSWVPDWTAVENDHPFTRYNLHTIFPEAQYLASGQQPEVNESGVLQLPCLEIDQIESIVPITTFTKTPLRRRPWSFGSQEAMTKNFQWLEACRELLVQHGAVKQKHRPILEEGTSKEVSSDSLWFVLAAGLSGTALPVEAHQESHFARYVALVRKIVCAPYEPRIFVTDRDEVIAAVEASVHLWSSKRLFGITKLGRAVLVPQGTRKGDRIVLPAFSVVPLVVREPEGERWEGTLLGEAFVRDVMNGEYVQEFNKTHRRIEDSRRYAVWMIS
ncbi:hypothetical protein PG985_013529 [Apiospora marii]|uniref:uncharacterized protein n=1 Tax=Apiospora marii TaxID=335849 RepID=UPI00312E95E5